MNEKEKENVKEEEEEEEEEEGIWVREQRKRKRSRRRRREEQLADRLDLAPASDGGQRQRQRAEVRGQTSVIFHFFFSLLACRSRIRAVRSRVKAVSAPSEKRIKKKKMRHSPDTGIRRVVPVPVSNTCPTPTRRQKWRVRAT